MAPPYNRLTGCALSMVAHFVNYDHSDLFPGTTGFWGTHALVAEITVQRMGTWAGTGLTYLDFAAPMTFEPTLGPKADPFVNGLKAEFHTRSSQGVMVVFGNSGFIGVFSSALLTAAFLQGIVLLGVSVSITTFIATTFLKHDGTSQTFAKYLTSECNVQKSYARSAAQSALNIHSYFNAVDPSFQGHMSPGAALSP
jgi:hypothetical protein